MLKQRVESSNKSQATGNLSKATVRRLLSTVDSTFLQGRSIRFRKLNMFNFFRLVAKTARIVRLVAFDMSLRQIAGVYGLLGRLRREIFAAEATVAVTEYAGTV